jgi:hypothetical protein
MPFRTILALTVEIKMGCPKMGTDNGHRGN